MEKPVKLNITYGDIENCLRELVAEHPELDDKMFLKTYMGVTDDLEPVYRVNIGTVTHPCYIFGTEEKIEEQLKEFCIKMKEAVAKRFGDEQSKNENKHE